MVDWSVVHMPSIIVNTAAMLPHLNLHCGDAGGQPVMPRDGGPPVPADALGRLEADVIGREAVLEVPRILHASAAAAAAAAAQGGVDLGLLRKSP